MEEEGEEGWAVELGSSAEDTVLEDNLDRIVRMIGTSPGFRNESNYQSREIIIWI